MMRSRLIKFGFLAICLLNVLIASAANTIYTTVNGPGWSGNGNWSGNVAPSTAGGSNNTYNINHAMTVTTAGFTLGANSILTLGSGIILTINGDVIFSNGSTVTVPAGAKLIINGNVTNNNNSDQININGTIQINGNFDGGNGSDIISTGGTGVMTITGTVTTTGTGGVFGSPVDCTSGCNSTASSPLPVDLIQFTATKESNKIYFAWSTASEVNNDYFEIERSENARDFDPVIKTKGSGTKSGVSHYREYDLQPISGTAYYRLKQTDFNGKFRVYDPVKVDFQPTAGEPVVSVFPNPLTNGEAANISLTGFKQESKILVVLRDVNGKEVYTKIVITDKFGEVFTALDVEHLLPPGIYVVVGSSDDTYFNQKLVINK